MNELYENPSRDKDSLKPALFSSPEGHIFLTGLVLTTLYVIWLVANRLWIQKKLQIFLTMTVTHVLFGRAAGMSLGYTGGLRHSTVIPISMVVETGVILIFYPLFVWSWRQLLVIQALKNVMTRLHRAAETNRQVIHRYGLAGLFVFVWFPFWMTGALIGCVIGFLLNLRPWLNVGIVLAGAYSAIISWAIVLDTLHNRMADMTSHAPLIILIALIILAIVGHLIARMRRDKSSQKN